MSDSEICCIFNLAPHYRAPIYRLMDKNLKSDFYFSTKEKIPFKQMNVSELNGFKGTLKSLTIFGNFYWQLGAIRLVFKKYKYYIITGEPYCISTWIILLIARLIGKETFLWTHGWYGDETTLKTFIKKLFFSLSSKVLLYGNYARNLMIKEGFKPENLICIFNSLDHEKQLNVRKKLKPTRVYKDYFGNDLPVILYIGRIQKLKKLNLLFDAMSVLKSSGFFFNLILIGKESEDVNIKGEVFKHGLIDNVWFFGACYDEETIGELVYNAEICVSPGNVGLTAMHSLVYGTPVITHNDYTQQGPEFEAIKKGVTGAFFEPNNSHALAECISNWLTTCPDRETIRKNCFEIIDNKYNPNFQISLLVNLFQKTHTNPD